MSIRKSILGSLKNGLPVTFSSLVSKVLEGGYKSETGYGTTFVKQRTSEALFKLVNYERKVKKISRGVYCLRRET